MDIGSLRAFIAVAQSGSFSEAATRLHITQPAVSKRIAGLEEQLAKPLFDRNGRSIRLTEAGEILLTAAEQIVRSVDVAGDQIRSLGSDVTGRLSIATSHHIGIHRLPSVLRQFTTRYPDVELDLRFTDSELAADDVLNGRIELAVATLPIITPPALEVTPVWNDKLVVVCNRQHALLQAKPNGKKTGAQDLAAFPAVLPSRSTITRQIVTEFLQQSGKQVQVALETNYLETIRVMVEVGLGWSVLPETMISGDITVVEVEGFDLQRTLGLMRVKAHSLSVAATRFVEAIEEVAE